MFIAKGYVTVAVALIIALLGPFALSLSLDAAQKANASLPAIAVPFAKHPWLLAAVALPAAALGVMMIVTRRYRWIALTLSTLLLVGVLVVVLMVLLAALSTAYSDALKPL